MPNIDISVPGFKLHQTDSEFELDTDEIGFFSKELSPKPDKNFISGIKRGQYHVHTAIKDNGTIWTKVKDQKTEQKISEAFVRINEEDLTKKLLSSIRIIQQGQVPNQYASMLIKAFVVTEEFQRAVQNAKTPEDGRKIFAYALEIPLAR